MFTNKVVWITGASSGIGAEAARQFNKLGAYVILSARNKENLRAVQSSLSSPQKSYILELDLEKQDQFNDLTNQVYEKFGSIDYLINNGGLSQRGEAASTSMEVDRKIMEINYFGNVAMTKAVLPYMQKQKSGHIVVISSIAGKFGFFFTVGIFSFKARLTRFLRKYFTRRREE